MNFQAQACSLLLAAVFILAALSKAHAPQNGLSLWAKVQGSTKAWHKFALALLIALEFELGWRFLWLKPDLLSLVFCGALLLGFIAFLAWLKQQGHTESCSCYGSWLKLTPLEAIKLDLFYVLALGILILGLKENPPLMSEKLPMGASLACVIYFFIRLKT